MKKNIITYNNYDKNKYLCIEYISPKTTYSFPKNGIFYWLVFITTNSENIVNIHKIELNNIDNINDNIISYKINKCIRVKPYLFNSSVTISLYSYIENGKEIQLLFSNKVELSKYEYNNKNYIRLFGLPKINGKLRNARINLNSNLNNDLVFLEEKFHNFQEYDENNYCLLFFTKSTIPLYNILLPLQIKFDMALENENIFIYDRYSNNIIIEHIPNRVKESIRFNGNHGGNSTQHKHFLNILDFLSKYCLEKKSYVDYIEDYCINSNKYNIKCEGLFKNIYMEYRKLKYDPYMNNIIVSPVDSRVRSFNINAASKVSIHNRILGIADLIPENITNMLNGSGVLFRISPQDYHGISIPYSGYISGYRIQSKNESRPYIFSLRIESGYYMPPNIHQPNYAALMNGNYIYTGSGVGASLRYWPELLEIQPDTHLKYYLIIIGSLNGSIKILNNKLNHINLLKETDGFKPLKQIWLEQGEEICHNMCGGGIVIFLCNRPMEFANDIKYYSKIENNNLVSSIDTYIRMRDVIGFLN